MRETITNKKALIGISASMSIIAVLTFLMEGKLQQIWQQEQLAAAVSAMQQKTPAPQISEDTIIEAKSAMVYDIVSGKTLYSKNADAQLPLASITKLVTALVADDHTGSNAMVQVSEQALDTEGESGLIVGDTWLEKDLSDFMLVSSSNDAATTLALAQGDKRQFVSLMNKLVSRLGLTSLVLLNESGLDISSAQAGAYGSARDISLLVTYMTMLKPELLRSTAIQSYTSVSTTGLRYNTKNTNKIVNAVPNMIGGKTGYTDLAGGNLAIVFDISIGTPVVVVVLGSTKDGRFTDVLKLVNQLI